MQHVTMLRIARILQSKSHAPIGYLYYSPPEQILTWGICITARPNRYSHGPSPNIARGARWEGEDRLGEGGCTIRVGVAAVGWASPGAGCMLEVGFGSQADWGAHLPDKGCWACMFVIHIRHCPQ